MPEALVRELDEELQRTPEAQFSVSFAAALDAIHRIAPKSIPRNGDHAP